MAATMVVPIYLATVSDEVKTIGIVDESGFFVDAFENNNKLEFKPMHMSIQEAKKTYQEIGFDMVLYIPKPSYTYPTSVFIYSEKEPGMMAETHIRNSINNDLRTLKLTDAGMSKELIDGMKTSVEVKSVKLNETGKEEDRDGVLNYAIGIILAIIIYFFIFMYGTQVMRGVIEEKTNRIVEVIISSIRPFQLMMGKIVGLALVGLTQFLLWVILTFTLISGAKMMFSTELAQVEKYQIQQSGKVIDPSNQTEVNETLNQTAEVFKAIQSINFGTIIVSFLFYFLFGYLLYAALFAAIGSSVDNETDSQQFTLPVTVPLIISVASLQLIANNPDGPMAFWMSIFPLTSPVAMMIRIPFGVPYWQIALSMVTLIGGFLFFVYLAAKIYRVGILMYGKKPTYKEIWKWMKYKM
jgi:ABC-2 type transport system permease protein